MKPEQYQVCVNGAKDYEAKIIHITNIIDEAQAAKQQGNTQVAEQKAAEAKTTVVASATIVRDVGKLAEAADAAKKASQLPNAKPYFFIDFKGKTLEELGNKWEVIRPDADHYALEKDGLLIINSTAGSLANDNIPNVFRLKTAMPEGDWTATVKFSSEFPAANEELWLALLQDKDHWITARFYVGAPYSWLRNLSFGLWKYWAAENVHWEGSLSSAPDIGLDAWNKFVSDNKLIQPIYLRLRRAGHDFFASSRFETSEPDAWVTLNKIAELQASGNLVFGFAQASQGTGQTQVKVDWAKIETP